MLGITLSSGGNISFKLASELSASMASTMMTPVFAQMNPDVVGAERRDLSIAMEYGTRLAQCSGNASIESVYRLVHEYPSHDFIIDAREANDIFKNDNLYNIIGFLGNAASEESRRPIIKALREVEVEEDSEEAGNGEGNEVEIEVEEAETTTPMDDRRAANRAGHPESEVYNATRNTTKRLGSEYAIWTTSTPRSRVMRRPRSAMEIPEFLLSE